MRILLGTLLFPLLISNVSFSQVCGGSNFISSVAFNETWLANCPGTPVLHSNSSACELVTGLDLCAPAPACASGTTGSDMWYYFFAGAPTVTLVVNSNFDAAIQAFSGGACPGLTDIGCVDAGGNNATETLILGGLNVGQKYYFRVFGAAASAANRTGTYDFCGTSLPQQFPLAVRLTDFTASVQKSSVLLQWTSATETDHDHFELERSTDNNIFTVIGTITAKGSSNASTHYNLRDITVQPGMNYYRLKIIDINGHYTYSNTLASKINFIKSLVVIKNPVNDKLTIQSQQARQILLINNAGQRVKSISLKKGINEIPVTDLKNGVYYITGMDGTEEPEKFVVSHY